MIGKTSPFAAPPCGLRAAEIKELNGIGMRVITGTARGRRLLELEGTETRPTAGRVKEGIFNIIQFDIEGRRVLDLFAGTGQLGIEALSRGAASAVFVEQRRDAAALVRENLKLTKLGESARVGGPRLPGRGGGAVRSDLCGPALCLRPVGGGSGGDFPV